MPCSARSPATGWCPTSHRSTPRGRVVAAKDIRPLPEVTGTFPTPWTPATGWTSWPTAYYGEPLQYWRICDANPQFLSPLALLGQEPVVTTRFPVTVASGTPPWAALIGQLSGTVGVDGVSVVEDVTLVLQAVPSGVVEQVDRAVLVTYNRTQHRRAGGGRGDQVGRVHGRSVGRPGPARPADRHPSAPS